MMEYMEEQMDRQIEGGVMEREEMVKEIKSLQSKLKSAEEKIYLMEKGESLVDGWIEVKNRLPERGQELIFINMNVKMKDMVPATGWYDRYFYTWLESNEIIKPKHNATHWQPLPLPPKPSDDKFGPNSCSESVQGETSEEA